MSNWAKEAENATRAIIELFARAAPGGGDAQGYGSIVAAFLRSPFNSSKVKTIIIVTHVRTLPEVFREEVRGRVEEWGVDGLLVELRSSEERRSSDGILESLASIPSCTTFYWNLPVDASVCRAISCLPNLSALYLLSDLDFNGDTDPYNELHPNILHRRFLNHKLLGNALFRSGTTSLQSLAIDYDFCSHASLLPLLTSNACSLKSLALITLLPFKRFSPPELIENICSQLADNTIALHNLRLINYRTDILPLGMGGILVTMLQNNTSLTSFTLSRAHLSEGIFRYLFTSLQKNRHLTSLSLTDCGGHQWSNASVLDCLQVNTTLQELDLTGTPLGNDKAITAQLSRNKDNAKRFKVLKSKHSQLARPTTVRLFFCGLQYSGKTTLSRSLVNWNQDTSWLSRVRSTARMKRTHGIEVTILEKNEGDQQQRILLWDMAGHIEFHSFHDSMFPDLSSRATPCMFLFIWNPFEIDPKSGNIQLDPQGQKLRKEVHKFRDEFKYWLRFIGSKTLKSENFKPKVLVAVTRADLGSRDMKSWLKRDFTALQEEFREVIQFDEEGFFYLNAKDYLQAGQLGSHIFDCAKAILEQVPHVYQACAKARELFGNMVHDNKVPPLITKEKFHQLCHEQLDMDSQEISEAVALSLNDSGDLIFFKSLDLVVLDTQWFCHKIMGKLLNDIRTKASRDRSRTGEVFFPLSALEARLENLVNSRALKLRKIRRASRIVESMKVAGCDLVKLLVGLRLACLEDLSQNNPRIFISISLSDKARRTIFPSNYAGECVTTYLGRRLSCKDKKCTFLTLGFFPYLQVTFHNILHDRNVPIPVRLEENVMAFAFGGVKVFIEFCRLEGKDNFIDILVYSSKSLNETLEWLQANVILHVEQVCAEPRGNQGVVLAHAIIQRACIENFLDDAQSRLAVSVKELKCELREHVEKKGDGNALYTWQTAPVSTSNIVDLLGEVETAKVVKKYQRGLSDAEREIINLFAEEAKPSQPQKSSVSHDKMCEDVVETAKLVQTYRHGLISHAERETSNLFLEEAESSQAHKFLFSTSQPSEERDQALYDKMCEVQENVTREVQNVGHVIQENVAKELQSMRHEIEELCNAVKDQRNAVLSKLCELFTFVKEGEAGKLPRMFVVTKEGGIVRRVVSAMVPGLRNGRLELLCECRREPCHRVDGQQGLSLVTLDDGLLKRGLPYINALLKVAYVVVRVGAHVAVGFGDGIPNFTQVLASIVDAPDFGGVPDYTYLTDDWNSPSRVDFQEGQQWLFDVLSNHNCIKGDQIHAVFGLRRVRLHDSRAAAWVCDKHYPEGTPWPA